MFNFEQYSFVASVAQRLEHWTTTGRSNSVEVQASATHFCFIEFFFRKFWLPIIFYLSFIISIMIAILLKYPLLFSIIELDPLVINMVILLFHF